MAAPQRSGQKQSGYESATQGEDSESSEKRVESSSRRRFHNSRAPGSLARLASPPRQRESSSRGRRSETARLDLDAAFEGMTGRSGLDRGKFDRFRVTRIFGAFGGSCFAAGRRGMNAGRKGKESATADSPAT
jgi:hypothetical protein